MARKVFFWTHLVGGIAAGVVIVVKSVTGIMLAYEPQIVERVERSLRTVPVVEGVQRLDIGTLAAKASGAKPAKKLGSLTIKNDPASSVLAGYGRNGGALFLNPYTGEVIGPQSKTHDAMHAIDDFHRWFGSRAIGRPISGAATLIFFFISLIGIYLWWPGTWTKSKVKSITLFNGNLTGKARDWNWHNVIGFWSLPVLAVISLTGVVMSYQWANDLLYRATGNEPPPHQQAQQRPAMPSAQPGTVGRSDSRSVGAEPNRTRLSADDKGAARGRGGMVGLRSDSATAADRPTSSEPSQLDWNVLWEKASAQVLVWESITLRAPQKDGDPVNVTIVEAEPSVGIPQRSQLTLDAATADVKKWEPFAKQNAGRKARVWSRYLHTGEAGGLIGQTIAMLASAGSVVLVWTGFALAWRRYRAWRERKKATSVLLHPSARPDTAQSLSTR